MYEISYTHTHTHTHTHIYIYIYIYIYILYKKYNILSNNYFIIINFYKQIYKMYSFDYFGSPIK